MKREVSPPGGDNYPDASDDVWLGELQDGFWEAYLDGFLQAFTEADGLVSPVSGTVDITRDLQQLIVFYAGFRVLRAAIRSLNTLFRAKAGPVEFETQQSANVLKELFQELSRKRALLLQRLSDAGVVDSVYIDAVVQRTRSIAWGDVFYTK